MRIIMKKACPNLTTYIVSVLLCFATPVIAESETLSDAISGGQAHLNFRYRYEFVDQDEFSNDAKASTLKTQLNYKTLAYSGWQLFVEIDDVSYLGDDDFNNTRNGKTTYPVVADPDGTDFNQFYLSYKNNDTRFIIGRRKINRDNQRFIGGVGWRQNEQTYDVFGIENTSFKNAVFYYDYINKVNRIFGPDTGAAARTFDSNTHLLNAKFSMGENGTLVGYAYFMDFDNAGALSNRTIGVRYNNTYSFERFKIPIQVEYANQNDYGDNASNYSANYYLIDGGIKTDSFSLNLGYEVLEGSNTPGERFQTPLATLHKFQGWTDKFLSTPTTGIADLYLTFGTSLGKSKLTVTLHDLSAEKGSTDYGREWNIALSHPINEHYGVLLKWASYDAEALSSDTSKLWLMFTAKF